MGDSSSRVEEILAQYPGPLSFNINRAKLIAMTIGCFGIAGLMCWIWLYSPKANPYVTFILAIVITIVAGGLTIASCQTRPCLLLDRNGFDVQGPFGPSQRYLWKDVRNFDGYFSKTHPNVTFEITSGIAPGTVPGCKGLSMHELARLLNEWRQRSIETPT